MKQVLTVSERDFDTLTPDLCDAARAALWEMWRDDLSTTMTKKELIGNANALLTYHGSEVFVTDVGWTKAGNCFEWELLIAS